MGKKEVLAEGKITPEMITEMERKKGMALRVDDYLYNIDVTRMSIKAFCRGIGDRNPLFTDEDYAGKTRWGGIVAPPLYVYTICPAAPQFGWRGLGGFNSRNELYFYKPIRPGDHYEVTSQYKDWEIKESQSGRKNVFEYEEQRYTNQKGELVCLYNQLNIRMERAAMRKDTDKGAGAAKNKRKVPYQWTKGELEKVENDIKAEERRGSEARFWEDVEEGEELKPVVKGPIGLTDMVAYLMGGATAVRPSACEWAYEDRNRQPAWYFRDPETFALEPVYAVHYNRFAAKAQTGTEWPYDVGIQRHCYLGHLFTNWMGDDGFLKMTAIEFRGFVFLGDALWIGGKVVRKFMDEEAEPCVEIETYGRNQLGEDVMPGKAIIALPSRERNYWPADKRAKVERNIGLRKLLRRF